MVQRASNDFFRIESHESMKARMSPPTSWFVQIHPHVNQRLEQTFEGLVDLMQNLPGMVFEMDGSFVWVDHSCAPARQMDAMVYDRGGHLEYIEVKGTFSGRQWQLLCQAVCCAPIDSEQISIARYGSINSRIRVHWVDFGSWTTADAIACRLEDTAPDHCIKSDNTP